MPLDPVQIASQLNIIITWALGGLQGWGASVIPTGVRSAMAGTLATAQAFVNSDRWAPWIDSLNGP